MDVTITLEHRFARTPDGAVWTQTMFPYSFWLRYVRVFDHVHVAARIHEVTTVPPEWVRADGDQVSFITIPFYRGPWQYFCRAHEVAQTVSRIVEKSHVVILRAPSPIASHFFRYLRRTGHPYGMEVVADPYECYAPGAVTHPLRPLFRVMMTRQLRRQCWHANAVSYVSEYALRERYPVSPRGQATGFSDIELPQSAFIEHGRAVRKTGDPATLVTIGSLEQMYKATDVLLKAIAACRRQGLSIQLRVIGDGKHRQAMEALAARLHLGHTVRFLGFLSAGEMIRTELDAADLFILPSRTEGMPRAMIEAMARGVPCIGSTVGGIPELLPADACVPPGDVNALAIKIIEVLSDPRRMARMSAQNLDKAYHYRDEVLNAQRSEFYRSLRNITQEWLVSTTVAKISTTS